MATDPRETINKSTMTWVQTLAIAILICIEGLEGFDIASVSFAAPGIAKDWGVEHAELGVVLGAGLIGMAIGSIVVGSISDKVGRRPAILGCLVLVVIGMALAAVSGGIPVLLVARLITGAGIGGLLATIATTIAEHCNDANRNLCLGLMGAGYTAVLVITGPIASLLLRVFGWHSVFIFGAQASAGA